MRATVQTPCKDFKDRDLSFFGCEAYENISREFAAMGFEEAWKGLDLSIEHNSPLTGWLTASATHAEDFAYFSLQALVREAAYRIVTDYQEEYRQEHVSDFKSELGIFRGELMKAVGVIDRAIEDTMEFSRNPPPTNPLYYASPMEIEELKKQSGGVAYSDDEDEGA